MADEITAEAPDSPVNLVAQNTNQSVPLPDTYSSFKEWPKWMYHRNGDAKVFDNEHEFLTRAADQENWHPDVHHWRMGGDGTLRSPVTGGAGDPALRAAANPATPNGTDPDNPPKLPSADSGLERVEMVPAVHRDPQRVQAAADSAAQADKPKAKAKG